MNQIQTRIYTGALAGAVTRDATSKGMANAASLTIQHIVAVQSNRLLLIGVTTRNAVLVTGVTYNGVAMTLKETITKGTDGRLDVWYLLQPDTGTHNIIVTLASAEDVAAIGISYYNVNQDAPFRDAQSESGA